MSGIVLQFRQPKVRGTQPSLRRLPEAPRWVCASCEGAEWFLYASGVIVCKRCHQRPSNLEFHERR